MLLRALPSRFRRLLFVAGWITAWYFALVGWHDFLVADEVQYKPGPFNILAGAVGMFFGRGWMQYTDKGPMPLNFVIAQYAAPGMVAMSALHIFRARVARAIRNQRARHRRDHVVLIGFGNSGRRIASQLARTNERCVVIIDKVGSEINPGDDIDRPQWAMLAGDATDTKVLRSAGAANATTVHVATGHDGVDMAVIESLRSVAAERNRSRGRPLLVKVQIDSPALCRRLQRQAGVPAGQWPIQIDFVDLSSLRAAAVIHYVISHVGGQVGDIEVLPELPVAAELRLIGDTPLIKELMLLVSRGHRARQMLGVPTLSIGTPEHFADEVSFRSTANQQHLGGSTSLRAITIVQTRDSDRTIELVAQLAEDHPHDIVVAVGPTGPQSVSLTAFKGEAGIIVVDPEFLLQVPDVLTHGAFDLMARMIHLDYLQSISDEERAARGPAVRSWDSLPEIYRESSRQQARAFAAQLASVGCEVRHGDGENVTLTDDEVELLARLEHERWITERTAAGWTYAPTRNEMKKTHPNLVPYDDLDERTRDKDRRVAARLPALAALLGMTVIRQTTDSQFP